MSDEVLDLVELLREVNQSLPGTEGHGPPDDEDDRPDDEDDHHVHDDEEESESSGAGPRRASQSRPSKAKLACRMVDDAVEAGRLCLFSSTVDETPHGTFDVPTGDVIGHRETHPVRGGGFSRYLRLAFYELRREPLYGEALTAALNHAEMRALLGERRELHARVAHIERGVVVDAGDPAWGAYVITGDGWTYVPEHPVSFVRSRGTMPFPDPTKGQNLVPLLENVLGIDNETTLLLATAIVSAYCIGPFFVTVIQGEQGSGKTTASRVVRSLTDPNEVPLRSPPREGRDLVAAARASRLVAYDNLSSLPQWLSDALSMLATGGGYEARQLYTDLDEIIVKFKRPVLLNGITHVATSADLLDRALLVQMKPVADGNRKSEEALNLELEQLAGELVGATFSAVSSALKKLPTTPAPGWARMVDATRWALAATDAIGQTEADLENIEKKEDLEKVLRANRARRDELVLEGSVFAIAVIEFATEKEQWTGTTAQLLTALTTETETGRANADKKDWPQSVQKVTALFDREAPILRRQGIEWTDVSRRGGVRIKLLSYKKPGTSA